MPSQNQAEKGSFDKADPEDITNKNFPNIIDSFDYPNASIQDLVKAISKLTGKNFILDPNLKGSISIITPSQITVAEAYNAFLSALASNGFTVVKTGKFLKIIKTTNAGNHAIETYSGDYFPNTEQVITKIIKLKYISANETATTLKGSATSKSSKIQAYAPTNSLIVTDYGTSVERITQIIRALDVRGFQEKMEVIKILHAKSKELASLLTQIIEKQKGEGASTSSSSRFRFRRSSTKNKNKKSNISAVIPDERTNSIVVVGNDSGIKEVKSIVKKLDFSVSDSGGLYVYYVKYGDAKNIAKAIGDIAKDKKNSSGPRIPSRSSSFRRDDFNSDSSSSSQLLAENISIVPEEKTNSLIISASKQDYVTIKSLLKKLDIARDQVFVKMVIMELSSVKMLDWNISYYKFLPNTNGFGRVGVSTGNLADFLTPTKDSGGVLSFGRGESVDINIGDGNTAKVSSVSGFVKFLKTNAGGNILSNPNIMALDNEEAFISVGQTIPVQSSTATSVNSVASITNREASLKLKITPRISPDKNKVKLILDQQIEEINSEQRNIGESIRNQGGFSTTKRDLKTTILVENNRTAVLGGLTRDKSEKSESKVPILGDLPLIGWLFKGYRRSLEKQHLVMFITPQIIHTDTEGESIFTQTLDERLEFINKNLGGKDPHQEAFKKFSSSARPQKKKDNQSDQDKILEDEVNQNLPEFEQPSESEFEELVPVAPEENQDLEDILPEEENEGVPITPEENQDFENILPEEEEQDPSSKEAQPSLDSEILQDEEELERELLRLEEQGQ